MDMGGAPSITIMSTWGLAAAAEVEATPTSSKEAAAIIFEPGAESGERRASTKADASYGTVKMARFLVLSTSTKSST